MSISKIPAVFSSIHISRRALIGALETLIITVCTNLGDYKFHCSTDSAQHLCRSIMLDGVGTSHLESTFLTCQVLGEMNGLDMGSPEYEANAMTQVMRLVGGPKLLREGND